MKKDRPFRFTFLFCLSILHSPTSSQLQPRSPSRSCTHYTLPRYSTAKHFRSAKYLLMLQLCKTYSDNHAKSKDTVYPYPAVQSLPSTHYLSARWVLHPHGFCPSAMSSASSRFECPNPGIYKCQKISTAQWRVA